MRLHDTDGGIFNFENYIRKYGCILMPGFSDVASCQDATQKKMVIVRISCVHAIICLSVRHAM
jgi:hypothetical protein